MCFAPQQVLTRNHNGYSLQLGSNQVKQLPACIGRQPLCWGSRSYLTVVQRQWQRALAPEDAVSASVVALATSCSIACLSLSLQA